LATLYEMYSRVDMPRVHQIEICVCVCVYVCERVLLCACQTTKEGPAHSRGTLILTHAGEEGHATNRSTLFFEIQLFFCRIQWLFCGN